MKQYLYIDEICFDNSNDIKLTVVPIAAQERNDETEFSISDNEYNPSNGDKLYFAPGATVPRVKLKDLSLQYKIKTVRDIEDATHVFVNKNTFSKITSPHWYYKLPTENFKDILASCENIMDDYYKENLREALEFYIEPYIICDYSSANMLRNSDIDSIKDSIEFESMRYSKPFIVVDAGYDDLFSKLISIEVYDESQILKHINGEESTTIDETIYKQLSDMFDSSDRDNHILAMEIMANSNYMQSLLYIEILFEEWSHVMADCHTKNHVNFKSLLSFLGKNKNYMNTTIDDIVQSLINKNVIDIEKIKILMNKYGQEIANIGGTNFFPVKSLTLAPELAENLSINFVHTVVDDFISEEELDVPEVHGDLIDLNSLENINIESYTEPIEDLITDNEVETEEITENNLSEAPAEETKTEENGDGFEWF